MFICLSPGQTEGLISIDWTIKLVTTVLLALVLTALTQWLKRCLHEYTNLFYRQTLFLQPGVMPGRVGTGSVSPIMHISLSAPVRAVDWAPPNQSASLGSLTNQRAGGGEPFHENKPVSMARARRGRCTEPVPCPSSGGVTQIKIQSYNFPFRKWIDRPKPPLIPQSRSKMQVLLLFGDPLSAIAVTQHCLVSRVFCLLLSWRLQTKSWCINSKRRIITCRPTNMTRLKICVYFKSSNAPADFAEVYKIQTKIRLAEKLGWAGGCSLCLWQLSVRWQQGERLTLSHRPHSLQLTALWPLSRPLHR